MKTNFVDTMVFAQAIVASAPAERQLSGARLGRRKRPSTSWKEGG